MNRMQTASLQVNTLPVPTWRHLKMNGCSLDCAYVQAPFSPSGDMLALEKEGTLKRMPVPSFAWGKRQGDGEKGQDLASFVQNNSNSAYCVQLEEGEKTPTPIVLDRLLDEQNPTLIETLEVIMGPESSSVLIRGLRASQEGSPSFHAGSTTVRVGREADLTLLNLRFLDEGVTDLDELHVILDEGATFTLVEFVMGSAQSYLDTHVVMQGRKGKCTIGCLNVVDKQGLADFNFHVEHVGEETESSLLVRGALLDHASKLFRGTIDFHKGCKLSKGSEDEYSVLLSPTVKNRSVPLILCGEENVEGVHAVSSGRLDHNALFYLTSRGIDEKRARRLLVEAQLQPILAMVSDEHALSEIQEQLFRRLDNHAQ